MADRTASLDGAEKYYAGGGYERVWPISIMVGGKTTSGTEAFLLPWVSVAGVYLDSGGQYRIDRAVGRLEMGIRELRSPATRAASVRGPWSIHRN